MSAACCLLGLAMAGAVQQVDSQDLPPPMPTSSEPITPLPYPPNADPLKVALGEALFDDRRLSHDGFACSSRHDVQTNGAAVSSTPTDTGRTRRACWMRWRHANGRC
jgi:cytochrome c peroxidase